MLAWKPSRSIVALLSAGLGRQLVMFCPTQDTRLGVEGPMPPVVVSGGAMPGDVNP